MSDSQKFWQLFCMAVGAFYAVSGNAAETVFFMSIALVFEIRGSK